MKTVPNEGVLRQHLLEASAWVKEQMRRADIDRSFTLQVMVEGLIQEDGIKLTYKLDCSKNYDNSVEGNTLADVTWELLRRMGWKSANAGLLLEYRNGAGAPSLDNNE